MNFSKTQVTSKTSLFKYNFVNSSPFLILHNLIVSLVLSVSSSLARLFVNLKKKSPFFKLSTGFRYSPKLLNYSYRFANLLVKFFHMLSENFVFKTLGSFLSNNSEKLLLIF